jgi:hypothetical protein
LAAEQIQNKEGTGDYSPDSNLPLLATAGIIPLFSLDFCQKKQ